MIREAAQNTIGHLKDLLNKKNKIVGSTSVPSEGKSVGNVVDVEDKINQLIDKHQEIEKHKRHCEELNSALDLLQKYNKKMLQFIVKSI